MTTFSANFKKSLLKHISKEIEAKSNSLQQDLLELQESQANETKSSAGDKYETSREMQSAEMDKLSAQLGQQKKLSYLLDEIQRQNAFLDKVQLGSLVKCSHATFLLGIPMGRISFEQFQIMGISTQAPVGQLLLGKSIGEKLEFNQLRFSIEEIW